MKCANVRALTPAIKVPWQGALGSSPNMRSNEGFQVYVQVYRPHCYRLAMFVLSRPLLPFWLKRLEGVSPPSKFFTHPLHPLKEGFKTLHLPFPRPEGAVAEGRS